MENNSVARGKRGRGGNPLNKVDPVTHIRVRRSTLDRLKLIAEELPPDMPFSDILSVVVGSVQLKQVKEHFNQLSYN